jgi:predicted nucleotidyltransferase
MASSTIINDLKDFVDEVISCGVPLKRAVLFGSYAKNKQTADSDIDLALVADEFTGVPSEDARLFMKALRRHYMIQPQTYNTKDFSSDEDPFVEEILKNGIEIEV